MKTFAKIGISSSHCNEPEKEQKINESIYESYLERKQGAFSLKCKVI